MGYLNFTHILKYRLPCYIGNLIWHLELSISANYRLQPTIDFKLQISHRMLFAEELDTLRFERGQRWQKSGEICHLFSHSDGFPLYYKCWREHQNIAKKWQQFLRKPEHNHIRVVCKNTGNSHKTLMYPLQKLFGPTSGRGLFWRAVIFWPIQMWRWHNIMLWFLHLCFSSLSSISYHRCFLLLSPFSISSFTSNYFFFIYSFPSLCISFCFIHLAQHLRPNNFELES